jgi:S-adenosylmethionine decarboxylase proenzyme
MVLQALQFLQSGFEGCEKKLEIDFKPSVDLRVIPKTTWDVILEEACCCIIGQLKNPQCDAYLLSESSLFVYPHKIMIKTCGTTGLLHIITKLLEITKELGTEPEFVQYTRSNFMFPGEQPFPHQSFQMEVEYLNNFFDGSAFILGPLDGPRWHLYVADLNPNKECTDQSLEVVMFDLPPSVMEMFFRKKIESALSAEEIKEGDESSPEFDIASKFGSKVLGDYSATLAGIDTIVEGAEIDSFIFDPCGYSCNALKDSAYFTIHITPEPECSFVSFDTNLPVSSYNKIMETVLSIFRPGRFCVCVFVDDASPVSDSLKGLDWNFPDYKLPERTCHRFAGKYNVTCAFFEAAHDLEVGIIPEMLCSSEHALHVNGVSYEHFCTLPQNIRAALVTKSVGKQISMKKFAKGEYSNVPDLLSEVVQKTSKKDPFFVVDFGVVLRHLVNWSEVFPNVQPFYNIRCNSDPCLVSSLDSLGCQFVCSSMAELNTLMQRGVVAEKVLYVRPFKTVSQLKVVRDTGVGYLTFDSISELETIIKIYPQVKLLLRVCTTSPAAAVSPFVGKPGIGSRVSVSQRYGVDGAQVADILKFAKSINANVEGISCHVDALCHDFDSFSEILSQVSQFYSVASECLGRSDLMVDLDTEMVDWSYDLAKNSESSVVESIQLLKSQFPRDVKFSARPSKYLVMSSHTLAVNVIARRTVTKDSTATDRTENDEFLYYVNDGLYGSFNCLVYEKHSVAPQPLRQELENEKRCRCTIFGPTCDGIDVVSDHEYLPKLEVGDWLYFENMGAFTVSSSTSFNGFDLPKFHYFFCG